MNTPDQIPPETPAGLTKEAGETPRTDVVASFLRGLSSQTSEQFVLADFARTLERELAAAKALLEENRQCGNSYVATTDAQLDGLRDELAGWKDAALTTKRDYDELKAQLATHPARNEEPNGGELREALELSMSLAFAGMNGIADAALEHWANDTEQSPDLRQDAIDCLTCRRALAQSVPAHPTPPRNEEWAKALAEELFPFSTNYQKGTWEYDHAFKGWQTIIIPRTTAIILKAHAKGAHQL